MRNIPFHEKENELKEKYNQAVVDISNANNVDMGIAWLMLQQNVRNLEDDFPLYEGAPYVDYEELKKDMEELDKLRRAQ